MRKNPITLGQLLSYLDENDTIQLVEEEWDRYSNIFANSMLLQQYTDWYIDCMEIIAPGTVRVKLTPPVLVNTIYSNGES